AGYLAGQSARLLEVVRNDLDELVRDRGQRLRPVGEAEVELRAPALRHPAVRDVADEDVLERVLALLGHRRQFVCANEVASLEHLDAPQQLVARRPRGLVLT